jgi:hypothetical protein
MKLRMPTLGAKHLSAVVIVAFWSCISATIATAATKNWIAGSGNWNNNGNWSTFGVPNADDVVNISFGDGVGRTVNYDYPGPNVTLSTLTLDLTGSFSQSSALSMSANSLSVENEYVGFFGRGTFNQSGGDHFVGTALRIGEFNNGGTGTYNLSGDAFLSAQNLYLHRGTVNISGEAIAFVGRLQVLADVPGSVVNINGGRLSMGEYVSSNQIDALTFNTGTVALGGSQTFGFVNLSPHRAIAHLGVNSSLSPGQILEIYDVNASAYMENHYTINGGELNVLELFFDSPENTGFDPNVVVRVENGGALRASRLLLGNVLNTVSSDKIVVTGPGSRVVVTELTVGNNHNPGTSNDNSLTILNQGLLDANHIQLALGGTVTLNGGTIRTNRVTDSNGGGILQFLAGTVEYDGDFNIDGADETVSRFWGTLPTIPTGKNLTVLGSSSIRTPTVVDGGVLKVGAVSNAHLLDLRRGAFHITNSAATVGPGGTFETLDVAQAMTVTVPLGITSQGLVTGDGAIIGPFDNAVGGELRAQSGRSLALSGGANSNAGQITLLGGELSLAGGLTNDAGALISGNGSLLAAGGLTNDGTMNFAGTANLRGDVINNAGGRIISAGGGATVFYDDVINNGEIRTSANGFTVFFGDVSGSGVFTGTGTVNFEGDLTPGSSPAAISFGGDVSLGPEATLQIELGGATAGAQHDQLVVAGDLALNGSLEITLIDGFIPTTGQSFNVLDWFGNRTGAFTSVVLPELAAAAWDLSQLYATGLLSVAPSLAADFDLDGDVDSDDLAQWQGDFGVNDLSDADGDNDSDGADFLAWQRQSGSGQGAVSSPTTTGVAVPEPAARALACLAAIAGASLRPRQNRAPV